MSSDNESKQYEKMSGNYFLQSIEPDYTIEDITSFHLIFCWHSHLEFLESKCTIYFSDENSKSLEIDNFTKEISNLCNTFKDINQIQKSDIRNIFDDDLLELLQNSPALLKINFFQI